jgi:hypothetical protein
VERDGPELALSFDGRIDDFVDAWGRGELPPRKRQEGPVRIVEASDHSRVLYSYAVPIAAIYGSEMAVVSDSRALSRTSMTTNRHLRMAESALRDSALPRVEILEGRVPETEGEWEPFAHFFNVVRPDNLSPQMKALWSEHERARWDEEVWRVLLDAYLEHGFGGGAGVEGIWLEPYGSSLAFHFSRTRDPFATRLEARQIVVR